MESEMRNKEAEKGKRDGKANLQRREVKAKNKNESRKQEKGKIKGGRNREKRKKAR